MTEPAFGAQDNGEMEAGGFGRSTLDALNCRKSEIVDIFLHWSPSIARAALGARAGISPGGQFRLAPPRHGL